MGLTENELEWYLRWQLTKFSEWKFDLGYQMGRNPLDFFTMDELISIFITRHGRDLHTQFFDEWIEDEELA